MNNFFDIFPFYYFLITIRDSKVTNAFAKIFVHYRVERVVTYRGPCIVVKDLPDVRYLLNVDRTEGVQGEPVKPSHDKFRRENVPHLSRGYFSELISDNYTNFLFVDYFISVENFFKINTLYNKSNN